MTLEELWRWTEATRAEATPEQQKTMDLYLWVAAAASRRSCPRYARWLRHCANSTEETMAKADAGDADAFLFLHDQASDRVVLHKPVPAYLMRYLAKLPPQQSKDGAPEKTVQNDKIVEIIRTLREEIGMSRTASIEAAVIMLEKVGIHVTHDGVRATWKRFATKLK